VVGADGKLENMRATLNEEYEAVREQHLLYFGPRLPADASVIADSRPEGDEMTKFCTSFLNQLHELHSFLLCAHQTSGGLQTVYQALLP
jgi:hypothetical protein